MAEYQYTQIRKGVVEDTSFHRTKEGAEKKVTQFWDACAAACAKTLHTSLEACIAKGPLVIEVTLTRPCTDESRVPSYSVERPCGCGNSTKICDHHRLLITFARAGDALTPKAFTTKNSTSGAMGSWTPGGMNDPFTNFEGDEMVLYVLPSQLMSSLGWPGFGEMHPIRIRFGEDYYMEDLSIRLMCELILVVLHFMARISETIVSARC